MIVKEHISARQQRARKAIQNILTEPAGQAYGDYVVQSASGGKYRVAMRGPSVFENFCSCADFAVNTLGTCKHIEALLLRLHRRFGRSFVSQQYPCPAVNYGDEPLRNPEMIILRSPKEARPLPVRHTSGS
jgi:hypothetical protein